MSDHDKLREAIAWARTYVSGGTSAGYINAMTALIAAAESTLPKTKMVEVWHIIYCERVDTAARHQWEPRIGLAQSADFAQAVADAYRGQDHRYRHVSVTGPHQQEVHP